MVDPVPKHLRTVTQFCGDKGGRVRDAFRHSWGLGQRVEDVSDEEMERRLAAFYEDGGD